MANQIYDLPPNLGDLMGAYDEAHSETFVAELKPASGVLKRGSVLSAVAADGGKLTLTTAGSEATAFGVLLDPSIDTRLHSPTIKSRAAWREAEALKAKY